MGHRNTSFVSDMCLSKTSQKSSYEPAIILKLLKHTTWSFQISSHLPKPELSIIFLRGVLNSSCFGIIIQPWRLESKTPLPEFCLLNQSGKKNLDIVGSICNQPKQSCKELLETLNRKNLTQKLKIAIACLRMWVHSNLCCCLCLCYRCAAHCQILQCNSCSDTASVCKYPCC